MLYMDKYDVGDVVQFPIEVRRTIDKELVDPDTLTIRIMTPRGVVSSITWPGSPAINRISEGRFTADIELTEPKRWVFECVTTGAAQAVEPLTINVRDRMIPLSPG